MDFVELSRIAAGHVEARILQVAVGLRLFDLLDASSLSAQSVAERLGTDARATALLLNALVALECLKKDGDQYSLTTVSQTFMVQKSPRYLGDMIVFESSLWNCWGELEKAIRTGRPARSPDMYQADPAETAIFIRAMHSLVAARGDAEVLARSLALQDVHDLLDIGAGPGTYPVALCRQYPRLRATIFDLPGTLEVTRGFIQKSGLAHRIALVPGDYHTDPIPGNCDLILLSNIIHSESAADNENLMRKVYQSLEPGGKVVIKDHILDDSRAHPLVGAVFSLLMVLTTTAGRCYSLKEVRSWLIHAGFETITEIPLPPPLTSSLVIGNKTQT
jgi:SAM-dependent methyltransferase